VLFVDGELRLDVYIRDFDRSRFEVRMQNLGHASVFEVLSLVNFER
jgi:hypothetical protein